MKPAIVLLGGFLSMYPGFIAEARARGLAPLVLDFRHGRFDLQEQLFKSDPGHILNLAEDIAVLTDASDAQVLPVVSRWRNEYQLQGVHAIREEFVGAATTVADIFELPSPGLRAGRICRNKLLQRLVLPELSPPFRVVDDEASVRDAMKVLTGPVVVKPLDSWGSQGVQLASDAEEVLGTAAAAAAGPVLLEERIVGQEVSVESLVQGGQVAWCHITVKETNESASDSFVEMSHLVAPGSLAPEIDLSVKRANALVLDRLKFTDGISHAEYRITPDARIVLMETAARNPGDGIMDLYYLATGSSMEGSIVDTLTGVKVDYAAPVRCARQIYLPHSEGRLVGVDVAGDLDIDVNWFLLHGRRQARTARWTVFGPPSIRELLVEGKPGDVLATVNSSYDRAASVIIDAGSLVELEELSAQVMSSIKVITVPAYEDGPASM